MKATALRAPLKAACEAWGDGQNEWSGCGTMPARAKLKGDALES